MYTMMNKRDIKVGDCVKIPDERIGRVRSIDNGMVKIRIRRKSGKSNEFVTLHRSQIAIVPCPQGWMSPDGYRKYLQKTLEKMNLRNPGRNYI